MRLHPAALLAFAHDLAQAVRAIRADRSAEPATPGQRGDELASFVALAQQRLSDEARLARRLALVTGARSDAARASGLDQAADILVELISD